MNSGLEVLELAKNQYAYGVNTTCRGRFLTHRPAYRKQTLILDAGVDFSKSRFQGACYYDPDFGAESIVAQIGGRLYQFVPDTIRSATVYDRTIKDFFNGAGFVTSTVATTLQYSVVLTNINDTSGASYPAATAITTDPAFLTSSALSASVNPVLVDNGTKIQYTFDLPLPVGFNTALIPAGSQVLLGTGNIKWNVLNNTDTGWCESGNQVEVHHCGYRQHADISRRRRRFSPITNIRSHQARLRRPVLLLPRPESGRA